MVTESLLNVAASSTTPSLTAIPTLTGTGDANTLVTIKEGASVLGTATSNASGAWSYTPSTLANGLHTLTAQETDAAGNTGTASLAFNLNAPTAPASGATATYSVGNNWGSGFVGNIAIAGGTTGLNGWTLGFDSTATITNIWGASIVSHIGNHYVVQNVSYDSQVSAGTSINIGFQATPGSSGTTLSGLSVNGGGATPIVTPPAAPTVTESLTSDTGSSVTDHITSNPALTGTADANATIHFNVDGTNISATATANASGVWTFADTGLVNGNHTVIASETNASGLTGTASLR